MCSLVPDGKHRISFRPPINAEAPWNAIPRYDAKPALEFFANDIPLMLAAKNRSGHAEECASGLGECAAASERAPDVSASNKHTFAPMLQCVQEAGDVVFVPFWWGHAVLNREPSIGVAMEMEFQVRHCIC